MFGLLFLLVGAAACGFVFGAILTDIVRVKYIHVIIIYIIVIIAAHLGMNLSILAAIVAPHALVLGACIAQSSPYRR